MGLRFNSLCREHRPSGFLSRSGAGSQAGLELAGPGGPSERGTGSGDVAGPRDSRRGPWALGPGPWPPGAPGPGSLTPHSGRPPLRMGSDGRKTPRAGWHPVAAFARAGEGRERPLCGAPWYPGQSPPPLCEGARWPKGSAGVEDEARERQGAPRLALQECCPPRRPLRWRGEVALPHRECALVPRPFLGC